MTHAFPQPNQDADSRGCGSTARAGWPTTDIRWSRRGWRPAPPRPTSAYVWSGGGAWAFAPWTSLFDSPWASDIRVAYGPFHDFPAGLRGASIRPYRPASGQRGDHTARLAFVSVRAGATLPGDNWGWASGEIPVFDSTESGRVGKKFSGVSRRRAIEETVESLTGPELGGARFDGPSGTKNK